MVFCHASAATLEEMAGKGDSDAQVLMGYRYMSDGTSDGKEKAKYWLKKAAEQGDTDACGVLGTLYYTDKNYDAAIPFLTQACRKHNEPACVILNKIPKP